MLTTVLFLSFFHSYKLQVAAEPKEVVEQRKKAAQQPLHRLPYVQSPFCKILAGSLSADDSILLFTIARRHLKLASISFSVRAAR